ncbi:MAG: ATP-dependent helicase, partial [Porticoccaceae bacterium]|nr:ATP-dependent helicase [Porticoccaceae bacterium]
MTQEERNKVVELFAEGKVSVLVARDVAARGLDVKDVNMVINFDLPRSTDDYIHRVGRTGRAGRKGLAISFITANDWNLMVSIEHYLGAPFERRVLKGLKAKFKGPKKLKSNGKAAGTKKKTAKSKDKNATRHRTTKNKGKRNARSGAADDKAQRPSGFSNVSSDGLSALRKKAITGDKTS